MVPSIIGGSLSKRRKSRQSSSSQPVSRFSSGNKRRYNMTDDSVTHYSECISHQDDNNSVFDGISFNEGIDEISYEFFTDTIEVHPPCGCMAGSTIVDEKDDDEDDGEEESSDDENDDDDDSVDDEENSDDDDDDNTTHTTEVCSTDDTRVARNTHRCTSTISSTVGINDGESTSNCITGTEVTITVPEGEFVAARDEVKLGKGLLCVLGQGLGQKYKNKKTKNKRFSLKLKDAMEEKKTFVCIDGESYVHGLEEGSSNNNYSERIFYSGK